MTECKCKTENSISNQAFLDLVYGFIFRSKERYEKFKNHPDQETNNTHLF